MRFLPTRAHALLDLVVGIILILSPHIFGLADGAISNVVRILGILIIVDELVTDNGMSLFRLISMPAHLASDLLVGAFLAISPWFWISSGDQSAHNWAPQLVIGLLIIGNSMITNTVTDRVVVRPRAKAVRSTRRAA